MVPPGPLAVSPAPLSSHFLGPVEPREGGKGGQQRVMERLESAPGPSLSVRWDAALSPRLWEARCDPHREGHALQLGGAVKVFPGLGSQNPESARRVMSSVA